jgi:folate-binding protein YgfZ
MSEPSAIPDGVAAAPASTLLRIEGRDALEVLHRIATQALVDLAPGEARATLFCDPRARLLHRAVVARTSDGAVWLLRDDAPAGGLAAHIDRHVFREDVRIADASGGRIVHRVPGGVALAWGALREVDGVPVAVQVDAREAFAVAGEHAVEASRPMERERILAGLPRHGAEIVDDFTPFEVGLAGEVHLSKGCFTGQESLMRLVTYKGIRRGLVRVTGHGEPPPTPADVTRDGAAVGRLTSAVSLEAPLVPAGPLDTTVAGWVGLAVLRLDAHGAAAATLSVAGAGLDAVEPFAPSTPRGLPDA